MAFKKTRTIYPHRDATKFFSYWTTFTAIWQSFKERLLLEKDVFVLITGSVGSGKSTLAGKICFTKAMKEGNFIKYPEISEDENNDPDKMMFIPDKHFVVDSDEFAVKMITEQGSVIWYDEAREGVNRQQWYDKINKSIKQRKNTNRKNFNVYFMILPLEVEFDPKLASHLAAWIWVRRGVGEIYVANNQRKGGKGLDIDSIIKREEKYLQENPKRTIIPPVIHPEYVGRIAFGKFTKKQDKLYKDLVERKHAVGKLTDEEKEKYGLEIKKEPKEIILESIKKIKSANITNKKQLWEELEVIELDDDKKLKMLNFYLNLEGFGTFSKLFDKNKAKQVDIEW